MGAKLGLDSFHERAASDRECRAPLRLALGSAVRQGGFDPFVLQCRELVVGRPKQAAQRFAVDDAVARRKPLTVFGFNRNDCSAWVGIRMKRARHAIFAGCVWRRVAIPVLVEGLWLTDLRKWVSAAALALTTVAGASASEGRPGLIVSFTGWSNDPVGICPLEPRRRPVLCVTNAGASAAAGFSVAQKYFASIYELRRYEGLAAGATDCSDAAIPGNIGDLEVVVDSRMEVDESDEENNSFVGATGGGGTPVPTCTPTAGVVAVSPTATSPPATPAQVACTGDCDRGGAVTADEIVLAIDIALGASSLEGCPSADRDSSASVTVDEIVSAISFVLEGCELPDLLFIGGYAVYPRARGCDQPPEGDFGLMVCIANRGVRDAGAFRVWVNDFDDYTIDMLPRNAEDCRLRPFSSASFFENTIQIDIDNAVPEGDEANNIGRFSVAVLTATPSCTSGPSPTPSPRP